MAVQIQTSFAAGELSPNLYARVDLAKYKVGAALLRNFFVDFRGGAANRPGTQYVSGVKAVAGQPRLIPFIIGQENSYCLIFGANYIWVVQNGSLLGAPTEISTPYAAADLPLLKYTQSADVMTLTHPSYLPATLTLASGVFTYAVVTVGPQMVAPTGLTATATNSGDYSYGYVVVAVSNDGSELSIPSRPAICKTVVLDETKGFQVNLSWTAPSAAVSLYKVYKWGPTDDRQGPPLSIWGYIGSSQTTAFTDNNIAADFNTEPPTFGDPFSGGQFQSLAPVSGGSGYPAFSYQALVISGTGTSASGYAVINAQGNVNGAFLTNAGKNYTSATITCGSGGATFSKQLSASTPLYPGAVTYYQQRIVYGGSNQAPETVQFSQTGNYTNFNTTPVALPTDAISVDIATTQVNIIKAFMPVAYGLLTFTTGGVFLVSGGTQGSPLTPATVTAQAQASNGINDMPPLQINFSILYVQNRGNIVRDLSFAWQRQSYTGSDISTFANHLFFKKTLTEWTWCEEPYKLVWVVRSDGVMLSMTYVPDQEVYAWARHDTNGYYRSVCSVPEGDFNVTYVITQRMVSGALVYFVERFDNRVFDYIEDAWFLDCGLATARNTSSTSTLTLTAASGAAVAVTATGGYTFPANPVGYTLWGPGVDGASGKATVVSKTDSTHIVVNIVQPFATIPNSSPSIVAPVFPDTWSLDPNVTVLSGLSHLNGMMVSAVVDGAPIAPQLCSAGTITLSQPGSKIVAGLAYQSQFQTLRLELDGQPTMQGKQKNITALTVVVDKTLGLKVGNSFDYLDPLPDTTMPYDIPYQMFTGEPRIPIHSDWNPYGQICIQQDDPLPATILGVIPEILIGDTTR